MSLEHHSLKELRPAIHPDSQSAFPQRSLSNGIVKINQSAIRLWQLRQLLLKQRLPRPKSILFSQVSELEGLQEVWLQEEQPLFAVFQKLSVQIANSRVRKNYLGVKHTSGEIINTHLSFNITQNNSNSLMIKPFCFNLQMIMLTLTTVWKWLFMGKN